MIFSVFHKPFPTPPPKHFMPIYVGTNKPGNDVLRDDSGDNIAHLNGNFCELTALYWLWKNYKQNNNDVIGFSHYRRQFITETAEPYVMGFLKNNYIKPVSKVKFNKLASDELMQQINHKLKKADFVVPYKHHLSRYKVFNKMTVLEHYIKYHSLEDWELLRNTTLSLYPEYEENFPKMEKLNAIYAYNMMISRRKHFDAYCEWMFNIIFKVYETIHINVNDPYQFRVMGFLSERLFNLYLMQNHQSRVQTQPVMFIL